MKSSLIIYWARRDLRLADNPALAAAAAASRDAQVPFLPLFILEDYMLAGTPEYQFGYPSRFFLAQALPKFAAQFTDFALVAGKAAEYLIQLSQQYQLQVFVNDDVYQDFYTQVAKLEAASVTVSVFEDALSVPKDTCSGEGKIYSVFTPFKKSVWTKFIAKQPQLAPDLSGLPSAADVVKKLPAQVPCDTDSIWSRFSKSRVLKVGKHTINLDEHMSVPQLAAWYSSEAEATKYFKNYLASGDLDAYSENRDSLELDAEGKGKTSKMSLALAWGLVSSRQLVAMMQKHFEETFDNPFSARVSQGALTYISELIWREFYRYQLFHHPELMNTEFQTRFRGTIAWVEDAEALRRFIAWIRGETGYPIVDAAMKQLAHTGWMHNRSRMVVASILTKNLGVDWRWGQEYFRAALIDLDEASNNGGWQWGASVGADPKPIRIFNPELQAKNYDKSGAYQVKWLGGENIFRAVSVPLVEHKVAREDALRRYGLKDVEPRDY
jgi:deoxyribodipyrimidine photo-lyase